MNSMLTKDARGFVDGVVSMLKSKGTSNKMAPKVQSLLGKMTVLSKRESRASVETSIVLTQGEKQSLEKALTRSLGRDIHVEVHVKPELIGGLRVQVGDWVLDTSLSSQLNRLSELLVEEQYE